MTLISQLDWPRILYSRIMAVLLGIAAVFSIVAIVLMNSDIDPAALGPVKLQLSSFLGAAASLGFFALLVSMGFFWLKCDASSKASRVIWFVLLLVGFLYGTQIAYYTIVYLPQALRRFREPESDRFEIAYEEHKTDGKRIGPFKKVLLIAWGFAALPMMTFLALPRSALHFAPPFAIIFFLCSAIVAFESVFHFIASLFKTAMRRPSRSAISDRRKRNQAN